MTPTVHTGPLRLISFVTCPYVHRARILLEHKGVPYEVENIDLFEPPDWFDAVSPRGRVPVLVVGGVSLFESQAICEYLEERFPSDPLLPTGLEERARDRAWFAAVSEDLFGPLYELLTAEDAAARDAAKDAIAEGLGPFEDALCGNDWLSGDGSRFGMADVAAAPFLVRVALLATRGVTVVDGERFPRVVAWGERVVAHPSVQKSLFPGFVEAFEAALPDALAGRAYS